MAGGLFGRIKNWRNKENVRAVDLNGEFNNIINNLKPLEFDDYSATVTQMRTETDPGAVGTESLATSLGGELERIRYVIRRLLGKTYWYEQPTSSLESIKATLDAGLIFPRTRVESGRIDANGQPMFLVPNGSAGVRLSAASTAFVCYINNNLVTINANVDLAGLSGPGTFTTLVNDGTLIAQASSKTQGENDTVIALDTPTGTPPTANTFQAWKIVHSGSTEYFYGIYDSSTSISKCFRGFFFDSSDLTIPRLAIADNDVITLCRAAYIFFTYVSSTAALAVTYNRPIVAYDQPAGASAGDWWFDLNASLWKVYSGTSWADGTGIPLGVAIMDGATIVGCRSNDFSKGFSTLNTAILEKFDNATVRSNSISSKVNVYGSNFEWVRDLIIWEMPGDLDSGLSENPSTDYYLYVTYLGDTIISDVRPYDRRGALLGYYHPSKPWRCIGIVTNDGSSNFGTPTNQDQIEAARIKDGAITTAKIAALAVTRAKMEAVGQQISSSSGAFSTTSSSLVDVTNLTATLTSTGRPVLIMIQPDGAGSPGLKSGVISTGASTQAGATYALFRDASEIARWNPTIGGASGTLANYSNGSLVFLDTGATAGAHTYKLQASRGAAGSEADMQNAKLIAWEL